MVTKKLLAARINLRGMIWREPEVNSKAVLMKTEMENDSIRAASGTRNTLKTGSLYEDGGVRNGTGVGNPKVYAALLSWVAEKDYSFQSITARHHKRAWGIAPAQPVGKMP